MAGYIGSKASVVTPGAERKKVFSITTTTTSLTGLVYTPGFVHVYHNGVRLVDGTDYTATNGTSITLTTAAQSGDEVVVISFATFQSADAYTKSESDDRYVNITGDTMSGGLTVNGSVTASYATLNGNGVPAIINSANGNDYKVSFLDAGAQTSYLGANASNAFLVGNSSATTLVSVDNSGRVIIPSQPAFSAWNLSPGSQYAVSINTWDTADNILTNWSSPKWNTETNVGSCFNTSNGRFTAPVAGKYRITASTVWWLAGNNTYMVLFKNGSQGSPYATAFGSSVYIPTTISRVMTLSANDTVEVGFYIQSSSNFIPGSGYLSFSGEFIG